MSVWFRRAWFRKRPYLTLLPPLSASGKAAPWRGYLS